MNCLGCGSTNLEIFREEDRILRCKDCKTLHLEEGIIEKVHYKNEESSRKFFKSISNLPHIRASKLIAEWHLKYLESKIDSFNSVLDIGANYGAFVKLLRDKGKIVHGVESNRHFYDSMITPLEWAYFDTDYQINKKFDLICFGQNIYYFRDNLKILNHAKKFLKEGGHIFISTINAESPTIFKTKPHMSSIGCNLLLSKKGFENLSGFKLIDYTLLAADYHMDMILKKNNKAAAIKYFLKLKPIYRYDKEGYHTFILLK